MTKVCSKCKKEKDVSEFSFRNKAKGYIASYCKECVKLSQAISWPIWYKKSRNQEINRDLIRTYGITLDQKNQMITDQKGVCDCCKKPLGSKTLNIHVDHCHETGQVRSILCRSCNLMLGHANDDTNILANAIVYLDNHRAKNELLQ